MPSLRQLAGSCLFCGLVLWANAAASQAAPKLPSIVVRESSDGVRISASGGALPDATILRLSKPDRLVLDFTHIALNMSTAERQRWSERGVRMAFHEEDGTTRVVFDIPAGQQRALRREGDSLSVFFTSSAANKAPLAVNAAQPPVKSVNVPARAQQRAPRAEEQAVSAVPPAKATVPDTHLQVSSQDGLLQVSAKGVPFKAILDEIASATGASVQMMTTVEGGKTEVFEFGPAPPMEVIKRLFEGSQYNYLLVSEPNSTTRISRIVVTSALRYMPGNDGMVSDDDSNPEKLQSIAPLPKQEPAEKKPD